MQLKSIFTSFLTYELNKSNNHKSCLNQSLSTKILLNPQIKILNEGKNLNSSTLYPKPQLKQHSSTLIFKVSPKAYKHYALALSLDTVVQLPGEIQFLTS